MNSKQYLSPLLAIVLFGLLLLQSNRGIAQTQTKLDSLAKAFIQADHDSTKVIREIALSREMHRQHFTEGEEYAFAQDAVERALQLKDTLLYARALDNFGLLHRYHQKYEEAVTLHTKAFNLVAHKPVKPIYKMIFANNAGVAARYNQNYDTAVSYYMKALAIANKKNDLKNIAIASNGIGNALGHLPERGEEAIQYFKRSLAAEKKRNNSLGIAMNYLSISDYYIDVKEFQRAKRYLRKLLEINKKRNDTYGLAITYEFFGNCYLAEGEDLEKARTYFKKSLRDFSSLDKQHEKAEILTKLGHVDLKQNRLTAAENYFKRSMALAKGFNQLSLIQENSKQLSQIMEAKHQPKQALYFYKQSMAYKDSINLKEQDVKIEALTRKYDLSKKENRIRLLEKDKALQKTVVKNQEAKLQRRRTTMILLGIGLVLILVIVFLQYRNSRIKKKTTAQILEKEKERMAAIYERNLARTETIVTRLRINPHFLFNSLNAIMYLIQSNQNRMAIKYLKVFSRYTRMVLETSKKQVVPLAEELKLADYYLKLEENRFEENFTFKITGETPKNDQFQIPPLLLQPFLENAIWHGLLPSSREQRVLEIDIALNGKTVQISIDDNGVGRQARKTKRRKKHKSMGMEIIRERISLFNKYNNGQQIGISFIDKTDKHGQPAGTRVVINLEKQQSQQKKATG